MKKRVTYFDLAKGIGIILVVLGHMENISGELRTWISSFHMPLFFVISGMLLALKKEVSVSDNESSNLKALTIKTAKGLLIPYFWFSLIYIPIDIMNLYIQNVDMHTFIQNILDSLTFSGVSVMWFLPALFIGEITTIVIIQLISKNINLFGTNSSETEDFKSSAIKYLIIFAISVAISILTFGIWSKIRPIYEENSVSFVWATALGFIRTILRGMCMSVHVVTGFVVYNVIEYLEDKLKVKKPELEFKGLSLAAGVILFVLNLGICLKNGAVDNHFMILNNYNYYYICALFGSMGIILICKGFNSIPHIDFLGKNSLIIMATHLQCYILYAGILIAIAIDAHVTRAKSYVYMFNSVLFTMLIEVVVIFVINRFFPFIAGKGSIKDLFVKNKQ